jgi:hypothetical protein
MSEPAEPAAVAKVRELVKQRVHGFEDGGPHTATFYIFNSSSHCYLRIGDRWTVVTHRPPPMPPTSGDAGWDALRVRQINESVDFNALGITYDLKQYPSGFVHGNCTRLTEALVGLRLLSSDEAKDFNAWSRRENARDELERAQARVRELTK